MYFEILTSSFSYFRFGHHFGSPECNVFPEDLRCLMIHLDLWYGIEMHHTNPVLNPIRGWPRGQNYEKIFVASILVVIWIQSEWKYHECYREICFLYNVCTLNLLTNTIIKKMWDKLCRKSSILMAFCCHFSMKPQKSRKEAYIKHQAYNWLLEELTKNEEIWTYNYLYFM